MSAGCSRVAANAWLFPASRPVPSRRLLH